jgi:hypothetical protein
VRRERRGGPALSRRWSPRRENFADVFDELVHFLVAFPHPRLTLELLLITEEEVRFMRAKCGSRRRHDRMEDRHLRSIADRRGVRSATDLLGVLPPAEVPRGMTQKIAYCFRKLGLWKTIGKRSRAWLYESTAQQRAA